MTANIKHGKSYTAEHRLWRVMRNRCKKNSRSHNRYYDRGITVCKRWNDFTLFLADVGERPPGKFTLERINNDKGYEPSNVIWATMAQQHKNRENSIRVTYRGKQYILKDLCTELNLPYQTIKYRLKRRGWSIERAVETPRIYKRKLAA